MRRKRQKFTIPSKYLLLIMTCVCVLFMAVTFFTDFLASPPVSYTHLTLPTIA